MTSRRFDRWRTLAGRAGSGAILIFIGQPRRFAWTMTFLTGTLLPPEEPTAENPPNGAMIDYFLPSSAGSETLQIFDAQQNLVRRFSADDGSDGLLKQEKKRSILFPLPNAGSPS